MSVSTCLHHAVEIQRRRPMAEWRAALATVPADCRPECEQYLSDMVARFRVLLRMAREAGFGSVEAWQLAKRDKKEATRA